MGNPDSQVMPQTFSFLTEVGACPQCHAAPFECQPRTRKNIGAAQSLRGERCGARASAPRGLQAGTLAFRVRARHLEKGL